MDSFGIALDELDATLAALRLQVEMVIVTDTLPEKKKVEMEARPLMREARQKLAALRAESRRTLDLDARQAHESICKDRDQTIRNFDAEMKSQIYPRRSASGRPKTYQEQREEEMMGRGRTDGTGFTDSKQVLDAAINVQKDALQSLQRTERLQNVTEETGKTTLAELQKQTERMYHIDEELQNLQGQIDHASRDLRWFYRQLARDKCFLSLFGLCIVALLVLVFVSIWTKRMRSKG
ncbi:QA-SNARE protein putative [Leishmania mexicana MHOM/GT/2001/U1103]|uniref:QA-SNARE protein putative n=1 Tax=Leishmania mexicana (strain MHOM/GT/2001/U1103) TaxID=929439 RepID=E9AL64_LEIMU|nr:QA-SNARE protein putative [Leishmania mexicana MHOM/GT/2001/U1103]CBZ23667.1 QA-SNARE protein putative [Leishmania mexicana MHOM/GT/2001/U1103]